jgi:AAA+ superfamily predicted ATPase
MPGHNFWLIILHFCSKSAQFFSGQNVFMTGAAGSGKSETVSAVVDEAKRAHKRVKVTALSGAAANVLGNASTIHSFLAVTNSDNIDVKRSAELIMKTSKRLQEWKDLLIRFGGNLKLD